MLHQPVAIQSCGHFRGVPEHAVARARTRNYLLIWVLAGRGWGKSEGERVEVSGETLLTFRKGPAQAYASDPADPWSIVWAHFDGPEARSVVERLRGRSGLASPLPLDEALRERFLEMLAAHLAGGERGLRLADHLFWGILGMMLDQMDHPAGSQPGRHRSAAAAIQRYVQQHLDQPIAAEQLAHVAGVSARGLSRLTRQTLGSAPMAYVLDQRIAHAAALLRETDRSVQQIALDVSYDDPYYFSRLFSRRMGCSPSAYRSAASEAGS